MEIVFATKLQTRRNLVFKKLLKSHNAVLVLVLPGCEEWNLGIIMDRRLPHMYVT